MSPEVQARIFEPFFTTKKVGKEPVGAVHRFWIVKHVRPHLRLQRGGQGSAFKVYLPICREDAAEQAKTETLAMRGDGDGPDCRG